MAISRELLFIVLKLFNVTVSGELCIRISKKWAFNLTASNISEAAGVQYVATTRKLLVASQLKTFENVSINGGRPFLAH